MEKIQRLFAKTNLKIQVCRYEKFRFNKEESAADLLLSPFIYRKFLVQDFVTEYKELWVITKGTARKADSGYNYKKRHYSGASGMTTMYYVRVNTSELDCSDETMDVEVDCEK